MLGLFLLASPAGAQTADVGQVTRQGEAFLAALAAKDAARVSEFFTEDAIMHVADRPAIRGHAAIRQFYDKVLSFLASSTGATEAVRVAASGDMAWEVGRSRNEFPGAQGPAVFEGKYLIVWVKQGGTWRIAAYALSNDKPAP